MITALVERGAWDELQALMARIAPIRGPDPMLNAYGERAEGQALAASGDTPGARESLSRALDAFASFPHVFEAARTKEALALVNDGAERNRLLEEAIATYRSLGAKPHLERAEKLLQAAPTQGGLNAV
jgi:hypothetical protein